MAGGFSPSLYCSHGTRREGEVQGKLGNREENSVEVGRGFLVPFISRGKGKDKVNWEIGKEIR